MILFANDAYYNLMCTFLCHLVLFLRKHFASLFFFKANEHNSTEHCSTFHVLVVVFFSFSHTICVCVFSANVHCAVFCWTCDTIANAFTFIDNAVRSEYVLLGNLSVLHTNANLFASYLHMIVTLRLFLMK